MGGLDRGLIQIDGNDPTFSAHKLRDVNPLDLVETMREGILVLDPDLTIRFANRSFYDTFAVAPEHTVGRKLYEIGGGQWDIPKLRSSLKTVISGRTTIEDFEVEYFSPSIGRRIMVLNARKVYQPGKKIQQILLAIEDITERARLEREHAAAHERIGMLLQELTHRVKNSLQFIAAMVMIEARTHTSGEGKAALERRLIPLTQVRLYVVSPPRRSDWSAFVDFLD